VTVDAGARMDEIVAANRFRVWIGKNCKRVAGLLAQVARFFGRVDADRDRTNSRLVKLRQTVLNAP